MRTLFSLLFISFYACTTTNAQYVFTGLDINPGSSASSPIAMTAIDTLLYFRAQHSAYGDEPWISDGTVNGTRLLKDIAPGTASSAAKSFTGYNGKVYFSAISTNGDELWVTDGNTNGTVLLKDINPGSGSSRPAYFFVSGRKLFFYADDGVHGNELWMSDGTANGTVMLKDIWTGPDGQDPNIDPSFIEINNKVYFIATNGSQVQGYELWTTDGTTNGTQLVADIRPGLATSGLRMLTKYNNKLYFFANAGSPDYGSLWVSDGTSNGTHMAVDPVTGTQIYDGPSSAGLVNNKIPVCNNLMFFGVNRISNQNINNLELWVSDGTPNGTKQLKDIYPGLYGCELDYLHVVDSLVFFFANDSLHGKELWVTDGSTSGTRMVHDIRKQVGFGCSPMFVSPYANKLFFGAYDTSSTTSYADLWVSDGTSNGTKKIKPYGIKGMSGDSRFDPVVCHNNMFFTAWFDSTGIELWVLRDTNYHADTSPPASIHNITDKYECSIAPNPAHDKLKVSWNISYEDAQISIIDLTGKTLLNKPVLAGQNSIEIVLPNISSGIYIVNIQHKYGVVTKRLAKD
ncbi:MAG: T9SS type A sorting domain-containing protein [Chitinophagaceae bacterium]|nr:T9SS type A sorting domain-containing protein [Chitinophagaceae bacterium]MCB9045624.1 T9SS type A sorting domain-containing protein [Chitinophagales bacterium]